MSTTLAPIHHRYVLAVQALKIVRRVAANPDLAGHAALPLRRTQFDGLSESAVDALLAEVREQLADQTVLSLYAAFESALRDHLHAQSEHLRRHATYPNAEFGAKLAELFEQWCEEGSMDQVAKLFSPAVDQDLIGQVGHIRKYRHWFAHGKRGPRPPQTTPEFAYETLETFLLTISGSSPP